MGNSQQNQQQNESSGNEDWNLLNIQYKRLGSVMVRVDSSSQQSSFKENPSTMKKEIHQQQQQQQQQQNHNANSRINAKSCGPMIENQIGKSREQLERDKSGNVRLQVIKEETMDSQFCQTSQVPLYTEIIANRKQIRVYVDKDVEFNLEIANDQLTCGWLLSEVTRRYTEELNRIKREKEQMIIAQATSLQVHNKEVNMLQQLQIQVSHNKSPSQKFTRKFIVALKTTDQRESLDFWLTQYDRYCTFDLIFVYRPLEVIDDKLVLNRKKEVCKKDFEQIKVIGRGGFSRVILVRKKDTGRLYAMKIMKKNKIIREKKLKPILSERKILEKLNHPFIIKLHWAFQSNEELFFVMDLCTGGEVFFHLNRLRRFSEEDIKPENILIDIDGHIRIADFGLSKVIPKRTKSYSFCGSPEYMSPEMLQGSGHDRKVDIYCLGALLFEMLTGLPPFYNKDTNKMYESILNHDLSFPDYLNPSLINLMTNMLQRDPNKRYQSISEIKRHSWLKDVKWEELLNKKISPLIIPNVKECHIDPDYVELPLDFEESQYKVRLSTERRYSYYYESTLQSKSVTEQSFYNMFFEKNESGSGVVNLLGGQGSSVKSGVVQNGSTNNPYGNSVQSEQSQQSQESGNLNQIGGRQNKNVIQGLENFTFIDVPQDELEIQKQLQKYEKVYEEKRMRSQQKGETKEQQSSNQSSLQMVNLSPSGDKNNKCGNQKNLKNSLSDQKGKAPTDEEVKSRFSYPQDESNKGYFTLSNKSGVTFEESNQSIAQELRINESIATSFGPNGQVIGTNVPGGSAIYNLKQTSLLLSGNNRLTIQEEEDDDLQSMGGSQSNFNGIHQQYTDRQKADNFSFKLQSSEAKEFAGHSNFTPSKILNDNFGSSTGKKDKQNNSVNNQFQGQTMTTATQSSQYNATQHNNFGNNDLTTSQYTITNYEETPRISIGTKNSQALPNPMPQFGRSGSQVQNLVNNHLGNQNQPAFVSQRSHQVGHNLKISTQPSQNFEIIDSFGTEKDHKALPDKTFSPKASSGFNRKNTDDKNSSVKRERTGSLKKKGTTKTALKQKPSPLIKEALMTQNINAVHQEMSFSRIPSVGPQQWSSNQANDRPNTSQQQKSTQIQPQMKKLTSHKHKPSYSLSPSNIMAAQATYQQLQKEQQLQHQSSVQQQPTQQLITQSQSMGITKQSPQLKKLPIKDQKSSALSSNKNSISQTKKIITKTGTIQTPAASNQSGMKSFLKAALPLAQAQQQLQSQAISQFQQIEGKTTEDTPVTIQDTSQELQISVQVQQDPQQAKKSQAQQRAQKFRSMDMTQNLLKKSMNNKGSGAKNNIAWKQHILQIQTSQSPSKDQSNQQQQQFSQAQNELKSNDSQVTAVISIINNKQSELEPSDQNMKMIPQLTSEFQMSGSQFKTQPIQKSMNLNAMTDHTPERRESNLSMDQLSQTAPQSQSQSAQSKPQSSLTNTSNKRQSDGSQKSSTRTNYNATTTQMSQSSIHATQQNLMQSFQNTTNQIASILSNDKNSNSNHKTANSIFSTPKGSKVPSAIATINIGISQTHIGNTMQPTINTNSILGGISSNGHNSQRNNTITQSTHNNSVKGSGQKINVVSQTSTNSIKTFGGISRNDGNQKKSNTAQNLVSSKFKKI
ncbi:protein kinase domain containing protein [Stylonychia lemnae]|uniref:non-specific serine/threonine protein kinase n=1 Tax=Stylonychia lemnae TaxID=5949 RepID=A0A078B457_STYLE|nr:protein kinase domain containing protein [Stylonychia lemnae]|eukprot:CDW89031.1 protein kinase domain containing protein [Stylonychia lemnae]